MSYRDAPRFRRVHGSGEEFAAFVLFAFFPSGRGFRFLDLAAEFDLLLAKGFELGFRVGVWRGGANARKAAQDGSNYARKTQMRGGKGSQEGGRYN
jgi:hypothetical protein